MIWTDIAFDCTRSDDRLRHAWAAAFGVGQEVISVIDDIAEEDPWTDPRVRIALERFRRPGEFPLQVMVLLRGDDLEARVADPERERAVIARLCAELDCQALTANDAANPYEWVLHSPDGETLVVQVDAAQLDDADAFVLLRQPAAAG
jgi:hypothetical protein